MYKFINNYSEPVVLAAATNTVVLALPDGKYRLSIADAAQNATRWEILDADVVSGSAALTRALEGTSAQEWPAGSVIYNTITAGIMEMLMAGGGEPVEPDLPAGNEYINIITHADGGVTYVATEAAESGSFYEYNDEWFYIAKNYNDLIVIHFEWAEGEVTEDPHTFIELEVGGVTKSIKANNIITTRVTSLQGMFSRVFNQYVGSWDTSNVTFMPQLAMDNPYFNQDIGNWDTSSLYAKYDSSSSTMSMFKNATAFNQDLSRWCVPGVAQEPEGFAEGATSWVLPKPIWGTCPS